jgi:geranylgeranyl diphosphate synthase type II
MIPETSFESFLREQKELIDRALSRHFEGSVSGPDILRDSMRYSVTAGGKRLRPILTLFGFRLSGGTDVELVLPVACALELIHTFSLIHDDLPAMDDDDLRRGKPSSHKVFGEGIAILAGDALFAEAFRWLSDNSLPGPVRLSILNEISLAVGVDGVIGGQVMDLQCEGRDPSPDDVQYIHSRKTAALIKASLKVGAMAAEADGTLVEALDSIGVRLGMAFQIADDILDEVSTTERMGKAVKKDLARGKCTYVRAHGLKAAKTRARSLVEEAKTIVDRTFRGEDAGRLKELADFIVERLH